MWQQSDYIVSYGVYICCMYLSLLETSQSANCGFVGCPKNQLVKVRTHNNKIFGILDGVNEI